MLRFLGLTTVFAGVLMLFSATPAFAQGDPCWRYANCGPCAADAQCGWCSGLGRCMSGGAQGSPYCPSGWAWTDNQCPGYGHYQTDACARFTSCGPCAADAQCGWCGATGQCLAGSQQGSPYCPGGWAWTDNLCTQRYGGYGSVRTLDRCSQYTNCGPCAADAGCGWCNASGRCMAGTAQGSAYCAGGWAWTDNQCGGVSTYQTDRCAQYNSCGPCAADAGCGWCGATGHCLSGTAQGSPYCPGYWAWTDNQCGGYSSRESVDTGTQVAGVCPKATSCSAQSEILYCPAAC